MFQPDQVSDHYFEVLLIEIPNQVNPKEIYLRGQCYSRQMGIREYTPFEWRPLDELRQRYEEPLALLAHPGAKKEGYRPRIVLEYLRDEDAAKVKDYPHLAEQNRIRKVIIGNCRLLDIKMEKNGNFECSAGVSITPISNFFIARRQILRVRHAQRCCKLRGRTGYQIHVQASKHRPSLAGHRSSQGNRTVGRVSLGVQDQRRVCRARHPRPLHYRFGAEGICRVDLIIISLLT